MVLTILFVTIFLCVVFDFINGFHDAANSIATIVSTKVLTPLQAVIWAGAFNFVAFFIAKFIIGEFGIANTVSKVVQDTHLHGIDGLYIILAGIIAAIVWNLITWFLGIPSSSSHTLIGGFSGAAVAAVGFNAVNMGVVGKIAAFIILAPLIGMLISLCFTTLTLHICKNVKPHKAEKWFKRLQLVSSALFSIGHGLNDSQKVMGIVAAALFAAGSFDAADTSFWGSIRGWFGNVDSLEHLQMDNIDLVAAICFGAIALGTMCGGWRIVKTMGTKITKVTPLEGVIAETAGAFTLYITEFLKIPVSTTHTITGAIVGVGAIKRLSAVRWGVTINLVWAWILTIPISALLAAGIYYLLQLFV
ncbi:MAG: inorganic phosphate transporter [Prevotellaceae bacterium]|jgi:PiT family inorganic phosphate transporter|nr:inorganic phosphate transporter [Prevotellaceae bacterium]